MINEILNELKEQMEWHELLATHEDDIVKQDGHTIAAMSYNRAMQVIRKHATEATHWGVSQLHRRHRACYGQRLAQDEVPVPCRFTCKCSSKL